MASMAANPVRARRSAVSIMAAALVRVLIFTGTCAGVGMGVGLFTGILVQVARSLFHRGSAIDMTVAYRYFGFPLAALLGAGALVTFAVIETRTARRLLAER